MANKQDSGSDPEQGKPRDMFQDIIYEQRLQEARLQREENYKDFFSKLHSLYETWHVPEAADEDKTSQALKETMRKSREEKVMNSLKELQTTEKWFKDLRSSLCNGLKSLECPFFPSTWIPKDIQTECSMFLLNSQVAIKSGRGTTDFKKATTHYLNQHFSSDKVFRVPAVIFHNEKIFEKKYKVQSLPLYSDESLSNLELCVTKEESIINKRRGLRAVDTVANMLEIWARRGPDKAFIFTDYEYQDYLKKTEFTNITKVSGDHDILAIFENIGVIFIQVKGCQPSSEKQDRSHYSKMKEALQQVTKDKFVFIESNRDLPFINAELPIYGFVALPYLEEDDVRSLHICTEHEKVLALKTNLQSFKEFSVWMDARVKRRSSNAFNHAHFKELCGRYVGLASCVKLPTLGNAIRETGKQLQIKFLTPKQKMKLARGDCYEIISGDAGTGKSLLLAIKADNLVHKDPQCTVYLVSCSDINNQLLCRLKMSYQSHTQLKHIISEDKANIKVTLFSSLHGYNEEGGLINVTPELFTKTIINLSGEGVTHFLFDEVPLELLKQCANVLDTLPDILPKSTVVWMAIATHSYLVKSREDQDPSYIKTFIPKRFGFTYFNLVMRVPRRLHNFIKEYQDLTGNGHGTYSSCGHSVDGPMPLLFRLPPCVCSEVPSDYLSCGCVNRRMLLTFKSVLATLGKVNMNENLTILLSNYAASGTTFQNVCSLLYQTAKYFKIHLSWRTVLQPIFTDDLNKEHFRRGAQVIVADGLTYTGCENEIILHINQYGTCGYSRDSKWIEPYARMVPGRSFSQYVLVTWPREEAHSLQLKYLSEYEEDVHQNSDLSEDQRKKAEQRIAAGRSCREDFIDMFLEKNVMTEKIVPYFH